MGSQPLIGTISASRASAVVGLNPYMTPLDIWQVIQEELSPGFNALHGYDFTPFTGNASTRWGTAFEDSVIELAESTGAYSIGDQEKTYTHEWERQYISDRAWILNKAILSCHIDGRYLDPNGQPYKNDCLHEGKTTTERVHRLKWGTPGTDRVPQEIAIQVQHQMLCTGAEECIVSVLVFPRHPDEWEEMGWKADRLEYDDENYSIIKYDHGQISEYIEPEDWAKALTQMGYFHQYHIKANCQAQEALKKAYSHFWSNYIIPQRAPHCVSYDDVKRLFIEPKGTIVATSEIESLCREYSAITKEIGSGGRLAKRKNTIKRILLDDMRKADPHIDNEDREKTIYTDLTGRKLASFDGKTFRS